MPRTAVPHTCSSTPQQALPAPVAARDQHQPPYLYLSQADRVHVRSAAMGSPYLQAQKQTPIERRRQLLHLGSSASGSTPHTTQIFSWAGAKPPASIDRPAGSIPPDPEHRRAPEPEPEPEAAPQAQHNRTDTAERQQPQASPRPGSEGESSQVRPGQGGRPRKTGEEAALPGSSVDQQLTSSSASNLHCPPRLPSSAATVQYG
ncbi:hypothetical protein CCMA1212_000817 [Trichoderma ghanense]|uniref:Uncharacterized protein n=1 Tax=Trichoderma ghanense TaxID=65468 RepID=A0ABY2HHY8_9HYPO